MIRKIAFASLGSILLACAPAYGQKVPELDGAPPPLKNPAPQVSKPAPVQQKIIAPAPRPAAKPAAKPSQTAAEAKAAEALLAKQAEAQKAERIRLEKEAADLKVRQDILDARAAELAAEEKRLATERAEHKAELARQQAELKRRQDEIARRPAPVLAPAQGIDQAARGDDDEPAFEADGDTPATSEPRRFRQARLDFATARRSCMRAGVEAARERDFYSAQYDGAPHFYEGRRLVLRGLMRLEDRRGYMIVDTVCEIDADGEAQRFAFLR